MPPGAVALAEAPECGQTMTRSDKIARWNALGVQGALLAQLLEAPLQLSTITVGRTAEWAVAKCSDGVKK